MQTILGANGSIASQLSKHLPRYTSQIRQVSRNPKRVNASDELFPADLLNYEQTDKAVAGSEVAYLLAGLKYDIKVWQRDWPILMRNVINACKKHNSKLVFFDNVYSCGLVKGAMTEQTPFNPCSKKGEVRAKVATMLLDEIKAKNLEGMIVRAADFYGPNVLLSLTHSMVTEKVKNKSTSQWFGNPKLIHSFTYTPDAGKSVALLGNTLSAFNQTWHALTSKEKITGEEYVRIACELANRPYKIQPLSKGMLRLIGLFVPMLREFPEMMYQYENDYLFDSAKIEKAFSIEATSYKAGIAETLK
jgi:nucleoside-diphosphate-sugar epimerase